MTLSDGLRLPQGTHICMPSGPISMDSDIIADAEVFDGYRWFRQGKPTSAFVNTSATNLHFGLGRYACPGRFFASYMMKAILSRLLLHYDFKFDESQRGRPKNLPIGDKLLPNMDTRILFKRRTV